MIGSLFQSEDPWICLISTDTLSQIIVLHILLITILSSVIALSPKIILYLWKGNDGVVSVWIGKVMIAFLLNYRSKNCMKAQLFAE